MPKAPPLAWFINLSQDSERERVRVLGDSGGASSNPSEALFLNFVNVFSFLGFLSFLPFGLFPFILTADP